MDQALFDAKFRTDRAPTQEDWDAMTPAQRARVVEVLGPFPDSEVAPPEGTKHFQGKVSVVDTLGGWYRRMGRRVFLASELPVYYPDTPRFAPDVLAVFDVDPGDRQSWIVSNEGRGFDWVLEVHVGGDRKRVSQDKVEFYARLGIPEYFVWDRARDRLLGFRLPKPDARTYAPIVPQLSHYDSKVLGLTLRIESGRLRFYAGEAPLPESIEIIERLERYAAELAQARDEEARQREEETRRREEETRRREEETRRREEETRRREDAERRTAELQAELDRLRNR